jgi:hypothetical protein
MGLPKWFTVIAVVLLAAALACAQQTNTIVCTTSAQVPNIRQYGLTEYIGEVDLACNNTYTTSVTAEFALSVNTTVTNATDGGTVPNIMTMAGLAVQNMNLATVQTVRGILWRPGPTFASPYGSDTNALRFPGVILPASTTSTLRIFNVRVAALAVDGSFTGTQILGQVTVNTVNPSGFAVSFGAQGTGTLTVATVRPAVQFEVTDLCGIAANAPNSIAFQQCVSQQRGRQGNSYGVKFTELQQTTFKNLLEEEGATMTDGVTEVSDTEAAGYVSNGTQLMVQFTVPAALQGKIHIWVSRYQTASSTGTVQAALVGATSSSGEISGCSGGARRNGWVELDDTSPVAAWEITADASGLIEDVTFGWTISYDAADLPSGTNYDPIVISGALGPVDSHYTAVTLETAPVVRFWPGWTNSPVPINIDHCVTNLLFPYVTNVVGFETGIAIANTSADTAGVDANENPIPFDTTHQAGVCHLYLFGSAGAAGIASAGTTPITPIAATTSTQIQAGQIFADTLSNTFGLGGATPITLSGYVIARCEFQFAHGYAYLVNPAGAPQGYLALIIPDRNLLDPQLGTPRPIRRASPFVGGFLFGGDMTGEQLAP